MGPLAQANKLSFATKAVVAGSIAFCVLAALCCAPAKALPPSSRSKAYQLRQTHFFFGDNNLIVSQEGILLENKGRLNFTLAAKAPGWNVVVYRNDEKTYKTLTLKQFEESGLVSDYLVRLHKRDLGADSRYPIELFGKKGFRASGDFARLDFLPTSGFCAPQVEAILYAAYKIPTCGGVPMRFNKRAMGKDWMTGVDETGSRKTLLDTKSMTALTVPVTVFEAPVGYRKTDSMIEVVSGKASKTKDSGLIDLLDAGH